MNWYRSSDLNGLKIHMVIVQTDSFHLKKEPSDSDYGAPGNIDLKTDISESKFKTELLEISAESC